MAHSLGLLCAISSGWRGPTPRRKPEKNKKRKKMKKKMPFLPLFTQKRQEEKLCSSLLGDYLLIYGRSSCPPNESGECAVRKRMLFNIVNNVPEIPPEILILPNGRPARRPAVMFSKI